MTSTSRKWVAASSALVALLTVIAESAPAQELNKFAGKWKANLAKSQRHPNHQFESLTLQIDLADGVLTVNYSGVNMSGNQENGVTRLHPDGKEHPIPQATGIVEVTKWTASRLETAALKDGKSMGASSYELSSDGATLTVTVKGIDAGGRPFDQIIVFDRQ